MSSIKAKAATTTGNLMFLKRFHTGSGSMEVHILSAASNSAFRLRPPISEADAPNFIIAGANA